MVIDSRTTAILSSDRLFSTISYRENLFKLGEEEKAKNEIFSEQGKILGEHIRKYLEETFRNSEGGSENN